MERPPSAWLVLCEDEALSVAASPDGQDLHQATAVALHRRASTLRLSAPLPADFVGNFLYRGQAFFGVVAAVVDGPTRPPNTQSLFMFLDGRLVGCGLRFLVSSPGTWSFRSIYKHLQLRIPVDFAPVVTSESAGSDKVEISDGKVVTLDMLPMPPARPHESAPPALGLGQPSGTCEDNAPRILGVGPGRLTTSSDDEVSDTVVGQVRFMALRLDCAPIEVVVDLSFPATVQEAVDTVAMALPDEVYNHYSQVVAVSPQPFDQWGTVIALPAWAHDEPLVILDLTQVDGRLFVASIGFVVSRERLCDIARVRPEEVSIFAYGGSRPVPPGDEIPLESYKCIFFVPCWDQVKVGHSLPTMLCSARHWSCAAVPVTPPTGAPGHFYCLATTGGDRLHRMSATCEAQVAPEIAAALGQTAESVQLQAGEPRVTDAELRGFPCRNVIAVLRGLTDTEDFQSGAPALALVDCRPLLQGWNVLMAYGHRVSHSDLACQLAHFAPEQHHVQLDGAHLEGEDLLLCAGQVLTAQFVPSTPEPQPEAAESSQGSPDDTVSGTDDDSIGRDTTTAPADSEGEHLFADDPIFCQNGHRARSRTPPRGHQNTSSHAGAPPVAIALSGLLLTGEAQIVDAISEHHISPLPVVTEHWRTMLVAALSCLVVLSVLYKWLVEPASVRAAERLALATLRFLARQDGRPWRYVPDEDAISFSDPDGSV